MRGSVPLTALRAFEAAARRGSFAEAAEEVGVSASAVSHHVRDLESTLGAALFVRRHRRVELTEAGRILALKMSPQPSRRASPARGELTHG